ncbi:MAG: oligosaccharide flippase family protein [Vicinamibacterales bacterium]
MTQHPFRELLRGLSIVTVAQLVIALRSIILIPLLVRTFSLEDFGEWAQYGVTLSLLAPALALGLPAAMGRFLASATPDAAARGTWSAVALIGSLAAVLGGVGVLLRVPLAHLLHTSPALLGLFVWVVGLEALNLVMLSVWRGRLQMRAYAVTALLLFAGEVGLVSMAALAGRGLTGAMTALLVVRVAGTLGLAVAVARTLPIRRPEPALLRAYLAFGLPTVLSGLAYWSVQSSDRYLIAAYLGLAAVGQYTPAYALGSALNMLIVPFALVLTPTIAKYHDAGEAEAVRTTLVRGLQLFLLVGVGASLGAALLAHDVLTVFASPAIADAASAVTPFVLVSTVLYGAGTLVVQILFMHHRTRFVAMVWAGAAVLNLGLNLVLIPRMGLVGAAAATLLAFTGAVTALWLGARRLLTLTIGTRFSVVLTMGAVLMAVVAEGSRAAGVPAIAAVGAGFLLSSALVFVLLRGRLALS